MDQDAAWKRLFGHPLVVKHLLLGFAAEVAGLLDLDTLEMLPASRVAPDGEQRHGDVAWRVRYADGSGRSLVLLIEFQSSPDGAMSVRVLRYEGMAFDGLRAAKALDRDGELRLLSVVVYSGPDRWTPPGAGARVAVGDDGEVWLPLPQRYLLLDSPERPQDDADQDNIVAVALWLGRQASPAEAGERLGPLLRGLWAGGETTAVDAVFDWLGILWPRMFADADPATLAAWRRGLLNEETGVNTFAERVKQWEADLLHEGRERGIQDQRALLRRQAERKFGPATARELARRLADVTDAERLALVGDQIIDCDTGAALLERMDAGAATAP